MDAILSARVRRRSWRAVAHNFLPLFMLQIFKSNSNFGQQYSKMSSGLLGPTTTETITGGKTLELTDYDRVCW